MNTIAGILVIAWIAIALVNTVSAWRYTWGLPLTEIPGSTPPVVVIVAVKNASDVSRAFFGRLRHQAYPDYRIIAAVESEEDPAFAMVTEESKRPGAPLHTVVAGQSDGLKTRLQSHAGHEHPRREAAHRGDPDVRVRIGMRIGATRSLTADRANHVDSSSQLR
jgi:hypothetical protein